MGRSTGQKCTPYSSEELVLVCKFAEFAKALPPDERTVLWTMLDRRRVGLLKHSLAVKASSEAAAAIVMSHIRQARNSASKEAVEKWAKELEG